MGGAARGRGLTVGVCWQGNPDAEVDSRPLVSARPLAPLAALPGVRLISLQKTREPSSSPACRAGMRVETLGDDFDAGPDAFVDTAAAIADLDLVVTADTSIAHLAGALGRRSGSR